MDLLGDSIPDKAPETVKTPSMMEIPQAKNQLSLKAK